MKSKIIIKIVFALVLTTALSVKGVSVIFAEEKAEEESSKKIIHQRINHEDISAIYQSALYNLVENGSITQEQADAIASSISERGEEHKSHFAGLISAGTITQAQADAINEAMKDARQSNQSLSDIATNLVSKGVITQEQADAVNSAMPLMKEKGAKGEMPKRSENGETFERKGPFEGLVSSGTITQAQADMVLNAVKTALEAANTDLK